MTTLSIFQNGFNAGYILGKYKPKLSMLLINGVQQKTHPYIQGFIAGNLEILQEQEKSQDKDAFHQQNLLDQELDLGLELE